MHIQLLRADITSIKVDAIVNPASPHVQVAGVGPLPVGSAVATPGGNLLCKFIIHAVVPRMGEGNEDTKLRAATQSALEKAEELAVASVGLPAMAVGGAFGFTLERCARVMLGTAIDFRRRSRSLQRAVFCLFGQEPYEVFQRVLQELES
ncbi:MAG TPA: macro domain-containing protein [Thermoanaerobaculia bacterium]|nr:macro domain-containing protein [Thermoanaerobaculia bacterium]